jgi:hypothetical protein
MDPPVQQVHLLVAGVCCTGMVIKYQIGLMTGSSIGQGQYRYVPYETHSHTRPPVSQLSDLTRSSSITSSCSRVLESREESPSIAIDYCRKKWEEASFKKIDDNRR